jgi:hypothetical protein
VNVDFVCWGGAAYAAAPNPPATANMAPAAATLTMDRAEM